MRAQSDRSGIVVCTGDDEGWIGLDWTGLDWTGLEWFVGCGMRCELALEAQPLAVCFSGLT